MKQSGDQMVKGFNGVLIGLAGFRQEMAGFEYGDGVRGSRSIRLAKKQGSWMPETFGAPEK